ncbi:carph-isopro domain-containing protein [Sandarakinorhabdus sp.]|uniref:carph-isopro domain-containing protein n=1 Tax=Sandarakinorhabdus sp. TaxID=1916663 RepID=UPI00356A706F
MLSISDLIDQLGGATKLAGEIGVLPSAVSNWKPRGAVPAEHRLTVWRMAKVAGLNWKPGGVDDWDLVERQPEQAA